MLDNQVTSITLMVLRYKRLFVPTTYHYFVKEFDYIIVAMMVFFNILEIIFY